MFKGWMEVPERFLDFNTKIRTEKKKAGEVNPLDSAN
ncbi:hypothetical protein AVDCRST_MAG92-5146 [uncultured Coleofasciculus sp.]|uniref:Uncharacterized protein n=1 Tax=uncultured Coleofasciculus sp. TaxID=1267456 RepID=A0A6J4KCC6_9CYAN|nr:hypothetical protein AVDCRST_MAG92-5146 [uncultured Coleofasciculus sp.]